MIKHINPYIRNSFEVGTRRLLFNDEEKSNMGNFPLKTNCLTSNIINKSDFVNQSCAGAPRCKQRGMFAPPLQIPLKEIITLDSLVWAEVNNRKMELINYIIINGYRGSFHPRSKLVGYSTEINTFLTFTYLGKLQKPYKEVLHNRRKTVPAVLCSFYYSKDVI